KLDMARGKPCSEQLNLSNDLMDCLGKNDYKAADGTDCRNYGLLDGLPEAKELFSKMIEVNPKNIIIGGNSSLNMMYDTIARAMQFGVVGSKVPWGKLPVVKFICPCPGYDRHFSICEIMGIEMIVVPLKQDGPDMDAIEKLVKEDDAIKGIWCVPKYSNPDGITYSDTVVDRLAAMETKAPDFRIFWDNAYAIHHLTDNHDQLKNMMDACTAAGNADRVFIFSSSSKVSFPGSGVAIMAASDNNIALIKKQMSMQTIGPDKLNQLRHVRYFKNFENIEEHMKKHAAILKPKFDMVLDLFNREFAGKNIAFWNKPNGGYFISLFTLDGCAKKIVKMAADAGLTLTSAGATYPYGKDPNDNNIRIAPTFPPVNELKIAIELLCICVEITSIEKLLS
ncbi:MAG: aminotransferase, partial [Clostridia bacterium]|nr:aminotransferase [Clostridia bacterium]